MDIPPPDTPAVTRHASKSAPRMREYRKRRRRGIYLVRIRLSRSEFEELRRRGYDVDGEERARDVEAFISDTPFG